MDSPLVAVLVGFGGIILLSYVLRRKAMPRRSEVESFDFAAYKTQQSVKDELDHLFIQIQEVSRESIARMDTRIKTIQQLLDELEAKRKELETLLARAKTVEGSPKEEAPKKPMNPLHDKVCALHDQGRGLDEICRETGLGRGEVELILNLRGIR